MSIAKAVELVASSPTSFDDAVPRAVKEAGKTIRGIRGLEVVGFNVHVVPKTGPGRKKVS